MTMERAEDEERANLTRIQLCFDLLVLEIFWPALQGSFGDTFTIRQ